MYLYKKHNAEVKAFFAEFESIPERHAKILADRSLRRKIRRVRNRSTMSYTLPVGLKEPKPEPVKYFGTDPGFASGFMYRAS